MTSVRRHTALLLFLLLLALALRLAYWERSAAFGHYELSYDDDEYWRLGVLFAHGDFFHDPFPDRYVRSPGFSLFLAPSIATFGPRVEIALLFQVLVSVLTVALTYCIARRAFGKTAGAWAMGLMAIAPMYASMAGSFVLSETLDTFLILLFIYLFWHWTQEGLTFQKAFLAGMLLGSDALVRSSAFYFFVLAAAWFLYTERARGTWALPRVGLAAVGMLLLILPYTARQFVTYQRFILIDSTSGWN